VSGVPFDTHHTSGSINVMGRCVIRPDEMLIELR
jgi:hypothetical protein